MQPAEATAQRHIRPEAGFPAGDSAPEMGTGRVGRAKRRPLTGHDRSPAQTAFLVLRECRPGQWFKNAVVLLAPAAAGAFTRGGAVTSAWIAAIAFCFLSSAT